MQVSYIDTPLSGESEGVVLFHQGAFSVWSDP